MQLQIIKATIAGAWVLAALGIMVGPDHLTFIDRLTLAFLAIVPPVAMWIWWQETGRTTSENIHEARRERGSVLNGGRRARRNEH